MKRALTLLAAGLLVLGCPPGFGPPSQEPAGADDERSALEKVAELAVAPVRALPGVHDQKAQKRTVGDIRNVGTAMFSWLTDQVGAAAAGQGQRPVDMGEYAAVSRQDLVELLVPQYIAEVPEKDGWGHPYEYYLNVEDPLAQKVMSIRSPGRDGKFSPGPYTVGDFAPADYDQDIVWSDGFFVRWPQKPPQP